MEMNRMADDEGSWMLVSGEEKEPGAAEVEVADWS